MKQFDFDPYKSEVSIRLATEYQPIILRNKITNRPYNGILYIMGGSYRYTLADGNLLTANQGDLLYLPAGYAPYSYEIISEGIPLRTAQVEFEVRSGNELIPLASRPTLCHCINTTEVEAAIRSITTAFTSAKTDSKFHALSGLYRLLAIFEEDSIDQVARSAAVIQPAVSYLEKHYAEPVSSDTLAELCHISPSQLRRNFKEAYGVPPMQYKRALVFKVSKKLLKARDFKIGEIAYMLGFHDIYEFSHFFVKMAGISPREYQNSDK